jgi:hypothetical protein
LEAQVEKRPAPVEPAPAEPLPGDAALDEDEVSRWLAEFGLPADGRPQSTPPPEAHHGQAPEHPGDDDHGPRDDVPSVADVQYSDWAPFPPGYGEDLLEPKHDGGDPPA